MESDLVEMTLHGIGVGEGKRECCGHAASRADGAEQVGALVAPVGGLDRSRTAARPLPDEAVLLTDPVRDLQSLTILEPDLDLLLARHASEMRCERAGKFF